MVKIRRLLLFNGPRDWSEEEGKGLGNWKIQTQWREVLLVLLLLSRFSRVPTLCDPIDGSPPGSPIPGILQARTLEWVAISFSKAWKWKGKAKSLSHVRLLATPSWTAAHQVPPSMGFSRQEYCSGVPLLFPFPTTKPTQTLWLTDSIWYYFFTACLRKKLAS